MTNEQGEPVAKKSILVIQTAFLGDIVLATSFLRKLRQKNPDARIVFLTTPAGVAVLSPNPWDIECLVYDKRGAQRGLIAFWRLLRKLRSYGFTHVYSMHRYLRSSLLALGTGAGWIAGFREAPLSLCFQHRVARDDHQYEVQKLRALFGKEENIPDLAAEELAAVRELHPELITADSDEAAADTLLGELKDKDFVALCPCSVWPTKRWPAKKFAVLAQTIQERYGWPVIVLGGNERSDLEVCAGVAEAAAGAVLNLCGQTSLGSLKAILKRARLVVANDSAPLHIAAAFGRPVVGIFGPTTKDLGFFPISVGGAAVAEIDLDCRPCGRHGHMVCPLGHFHCMVKLDADRVMATAEQILCP